MLGAATRTLSSWAVDGVRNCLQAKTAKKDKMMEARGNFRVYQRFEMAGAVIVRCRQVRRSVRVAKPFSMTLRVRNPVDNFASQATGTLIDFDRCKI